MAGSGERRRGGGGCGGGKISLEAENEYTHVSGIKQGYDGLGSIVDFGGEGCGLFTGFRLPVVSPYDQGGVGFTAIPEREILDPCTSFMVLLFGGVYFDP